MKLCKDCKFYEKSRCNSPHIPEETDPVTGEKLLPWHKTFSDVYYQRSVDAPGGTLLSLCYKLLRLANKEPGKLCGREAKFFEHKDGVATTPSGQFRITHEMIEMYNRMRSSLRDRITSTRP